jgi:Leucine-rich repeat (LRR) protein
MQGGPVLFAGQLQKLTLNGNGLTELPDSLKGLTSLTALALHANNLTTLPPSFASLQALEDLNLADNELSSLPDDGLESLKALRVVWIYNNALKSIPVNVLKAPALKGVILASCCSDPSARSVPVLLFVYFRCDHCAAAGSHVYLTI